MTRSAPSCFAAWHPCRPPGRKRRLRRRHPPAPLRRFLPELIDLIRDRKIDPGKVFDLELPLDDAAAGYEAMDERGAIKVLLRP